MRLFGCDKKTLARLDHIEKQLGIKEKVYGSCDPMSVMLVPPSFEDIIRKEWAAVTILKRIESLEEDVSLLSSYLKIAKTTDPERTRFVRIHHRKK